MRHSRSHLVLTLLLMATLGCARAPAGPEQTELVDEQFASPIVVRLSEAEAEAGRQFQPLAKQFALPRFATAGRSLDGGALYEFLPKGDQIISWTRLGSVHVRQVGATRADAALILPDYVSNLRGRAAVVHKTEFYSVPNGGLYLTHYEARANRGIYFEEGLSAIWVTAPGYIANFQVMSRGPAVPVPAPQVKKFWEVFLSLAEPNAR
jgi:hypothetical protein